MPSSSMGVDFRDVNDDGRPDLIYTALSGETFSVRLNQGKGSFEDFTYQSGIGIVSSGMSGWAVGAYDFDQDGHKDLFISNSHVSENVHLYSHYFYKQRNAVFRNMGGGKFRDATAQTSRWPGRFRGRTEDVLSAT